MANWSFLTSHARAAVHRTRSGRAVTRRRGQPGHPERGAHGIVTDLATAGYVLKQKDGRRNRYQIQAHLPLPEPTSQQLAIGEVLALLAGATAGTQPAGGNQPEASTTPGVAATEPGGIPA